ncbi:hypothetical protein K504DRAFT_461037 [Pleomassaria siparia CBS 279.74]|uniref:F-box domain-containing protein n=1 Tax=Pleomassaria siparia CBS 279.74 TaxID=1314801 RepID=A0A6G1JVZ0_9PLEO|nr:hypothetical protein K504DRAFT_461037 [Pleomassaria siparia CBS 279.74]
MKRLRLPLPLPRAAAARRLKLHLPFPKPNPTSNPFLPLLILFPPPPPPSPSPLPLSPSRLTAHHHPASHPYDIVAAVSGSALRHLGHLARLPLRAWPGSAMVNHKNVTFTVNKQTPIEEPPPVAYGIVINYGKPGAKRASRGVYSAKSKSHKDLLGKGQKDRRKRNADDVDDEGHESTHSKKLIMSRHNYDAAAMANSSRLFATKKPQVLGPTKFRKGRALSKGVDLDCWFTILTFSDPAQLLEMRCKIVSCYRFLRDNPTLWKHSRSYYYRDTLPEPPAELTEFQYAHLRHGHGCMSCGARSTRKTYWPFLRRWCKNCLQSKVIKGQDVLALMKDTNGEDISYIQKCLPSGMFDSWGNFVGVGPANNHSLKTVYLLADVQKLVADYRQESRDNLVSWHAEVRTWMGNKVKIVEDRREFARKMEHWEDMTRTSKSYGHQEKKTARKIYFAEKAASLTPPISIQEMALCSSYKRAIAIPKEPNMTSWLQLRPKLEKEAADLKMQLAIENHSPHPSSTGTSTPSQNETNCPSSSYQYSYPTTRMPEPAAHSNPLDYMTMHSTVANMPPLPNNYPPIIYPYPSSSAQMPQ